MRLQNLFYGRKWNGEPFDKPLFKFSDINEPEEEPKEEKENGT